MTFSFVSVIELKCSLPGTTCQKVLKKLALDISAGFASHPSVEAEVLKSPNLQAGQTTLLVLRSSLQICCFLQLGHFFENYLIQLRLSPSNYSTSSLVEASNFFAVFEGPNSSAGHFVVIGVGASDLILVAGDKGSD